MKNIYLCKGKVVTASSKAKAIQVIATSTSNKKVEDFLVKVLKGYVSEENVRKYSKEIENCFEEGMFHWVSSKNQYELKIYKDRNDYIDDDVIKNIDTFEGYYNYIWDAYLDYVSQEFFELVNRIENVLNDEGVEIEDVDNDLSNHIQDYVDVDYPDFLSDTINVTIQVKNTNNIKKFIYGSSSNISIATKLVNGKLNKIVADSLILAVEREQGKLSNNDSDRIKEVTSFLDENDKLANEQEVMLLSSVDLTIRDYLSIKDKTNYYSEEKHNVIDVSSYGNAVLNYGYEEYAFPSLDIKIKELKVSDILDVLF